MKWQDGFVDLSLAPLQDHRDVGEDLFQSNTAALFFGNLEATVESEE